MKGCFAVLSALLFILPTDAKAADDLSGAARELARKIAALAGRGETVSVLWRNLSSLSPGDLMLAEGAFETVLRDSGVRVAGAATTADARLTLSENLQQYLLVAEMRKGEDRQTFIASWKRTAATAISGGSLALERKLIWEQADPILDLALTPTAMLVLSPLRITLYARHEAALEERQSLPIAPARPWPRDPRARIQLTGSAFRAFLPGTLCVGAIEPALAVECRPSDEPWTLESGSRIVLLAAFAPNRNYFDGRLVMQNGARKTVPPFYTAGAVEDQGRAWWLLTLVDGRTQLFDANFEPTGAVPGWGSDLAATAAHCGAGSQILAGKPGDAHDPDSIRAYALVNRAPVPLASPVDFPGPVTALWTLNGISAIAVVRDLSSGHYMAFQLTVTCGG